MNLVRHPLRYRFGPYCLDVTARRLTRNGEEIALTPKAFDLLLFLVSNPGQILSKEQIKTHLWLGVHVTEKNLSVQMVTVRKALDDDAEEPRYVQTLPRRGYMFLGTVTVDVADGEESSVDLAPQIEEKARELTGHHPWAAIWRGPLAVAASILMFALFLALSNPGGQAFHSEKPRTAFEAISRQARIPFEKGQYFWLQRGAGKENLLKAIGYYSETIRIDPNAAEAYSGMSQAYISLADYLNSTTPALENAAAAAESALRLNPNSAEAHLALAVIQSEGKWQWKSAEHEYAEAIRLDPGNVTAHQWYGSFLTLLGRRDAALNEARRATELGPTNAPAFKSLGEVCLYAKDYPCATDAFQTAVELNPTFAQANQALDEIYLEHDGFENRKGDEPVLLQIAPSLPRIGDQVLNPHDVKAYWRANLKALLQKEDGKSTPAFVLARAYAMTGDKAKALDTIEAAVRNHSGPIRYLVVDHHFDALRNEPRFIAALARMGLPAMNDSQQAGMAGTKYLR